jgi:hypothetical protein
MSDRIVKELFDKGFIREDQYKRIEPIVSGKIISVFYELRTLLYLGVMLLATGLGILIYENIGELGHLIAIVALCTIAGVCFWYVMQKAVPYSNSKVSSPSPYFDYILLLGCLLVVVIQGYLQFQYEILDNALGLSTLLSAAFFFAMAYRYDHVGILSLGITALASFWSISISPQKWYSSNFFSSSSHLHNTAIIFSVALASISIFLDKRSIKEHFTFTYINFCSLIFFVGAIAGMFIEDLYGIYLLIIYAGCVMAFFFAKWKRSFLFLLYAFLSVYIGTTFLLADTVFNYEPMLWFYYSILSCGGFIYFIIKYKNYFTRND